MVIETKYLGKMDIDEEKIILFENGIPGFIDEKEFIILDIPGNDLLQLLQSLRSPHLAFFIANPHQFDQSYHFILPESVLEALQITTEEEVIILSIMTINEPFHTSTINLQAPIIINYRTRLGKQIILNEERFSMKTAISSPKQTEKGDSSCSF